jgi:hypothetical protein
MEQVGAARKRQAASPGAKDKETPMTDPLDEARYELALANRIIAHEGVLDGFGHVRMRHPSDRGATCSPARAAPS